MVTATTDWDLEIRKRYSQPLASETGEFPDTDSIYNRMIPICYEEGIIGGASEATASFLNVATETFIKEVISGIFSRTRSNGSNFIMTAAYKHQHKREEELFLKGDLQKNGIAMLPVEHAAASKRPPLGLNDFRLSLEMGDMFLGHMPLLVERIIGGYMESEFQEEVDLGIPVGAGGIGSWSQEGANGVDDGMDMQMDDADWGYGPGACGPESDALDILLDECLAVGA